MADICSTVYSIFFIYCLHWRLLNSLAKVLDFIFSTHKIYIILPIHFFISIFAVRVMRIVAKQWRTLKYERFLSRYLIFKKAQQPTNYKEVILFYKTYGKSVEYPSDFGRNANLKLKIKQLEENRSSWAEGRKPLLGGLKKKNFPDYCLMEVPTWQWLFRFPVFRRVAF